LKEVLSVLRVPGNSPNDAGNHSRMSLVEFHVRCLDPRFGEAYEPNVAQPFLCIGFFFPRAHFTSISQVLFGLTFRG
jgi:hypothetical protein